METFLSLSRLRINEKTGGTLIIIGVKLIKSFVNNNSKG